jgi:hypothetical protein
MRTLRYAAIGFLLGSAWMTVARVWMRLVSTEPEFTWTGTLSIVGATAVVGTVLGIVHAARRRGASAWWRMLALVGLVIFTSPGAVLLPAAVLGGWGLRRGTIGRVVAGLGILSAPVLLVVAEWEFVNTHLMPYPETVYRAVLGAGSLLLGGTAAWASSIALGPWRRGRTTALEPNQAAAVAA